MTSRRPVCARCQRPQSVCYCPQLPAPIANHWPIHIFQHVREQHHAIGTARIAQLGLQDCHTRTVMDEKVITALPANAVLVYPGEQSTAVEEWDVAEPRPLIFLDGSWRKAQRMLLGSPALQNLPQISFVPEARSRYRIRKAPDPLFYSTLEAITHVLGVLERDAEKYAPLLAVMDWMVDQQIAAMGEATYLANHARLKRD